MKKELAEGWRWSTRRRISRTESGRSMSPKDLRSLGVAFRIDLAGRFKNSAGGTPNCG